MIAHKEVLKMVIDLMASEPVYQPNCMQGVPIPAEFAGRQKPKRELGTIRFADGYNLVSPRTTVGIAPGSSAVDERRCTRREGLL